MTTPTWRVRAALALPLVLLAGCNRPTGTAWTPGVDGPAGGPAAFATPTRTTPPQAGASVVPAPAPQPAGSGALDGTTGGETPDTAAVR